VTPTPSQPLDLDAAQDATLYTDPSILPVYDSSARLRAAYTKYLELLAFLGREYLTLKEILAATAYKEFGSTKENVYEKSQELLGRQFFDFCDNDGICEGNQLWKFLGSFSGWYLSNVNELKKGMNDSKSKATADLIFSKSSWKDGYSWEDPFYNGNTSMYPKSRRDILKAGEGKAEYKSLALDVDQEYFVWSPKQRHYWREQESGGN